MIKPRAKHKVSIILLLLFGFTHEANAKPLIEAYGVWDIDLSSAINSIEAKRGKSLAKFPIFPNKLISIDDNIIDLDNGKIKIPKGTQFIDYKINDKMAFCSTRTLDSIANTILYFRMSGTYACLSDTDGDGMLDELFEFRSFNVSTAPILTYGRATEREKFNPVSFKYIDVSKFDNPMDLEIFWWRGDAFADRFYVNAKITTTNNIYLQLNQYAGLDRGGVPGTFQFIGVDYAVSSNAAGTANVFLRKRSDAIRMMIAGPRVVFE